MKDALINFLKEQDDVVAVYCKVVSFGGKPANDKYSVVFYKKDSDSFSINVDFTEEELTKAKLYWNFIANEPENCHIFSVANEWL